MCEDLFRGALQEHFAVAVLSTPLKLMGLDVVHKGTTDSTQVHPADVLRPAILLGSTRIVVAHNHPSGDPTPSAADRIITTRLREAAELFGIDLLDHIVVGHEKYYSFAEEGIFPLC